jgi:hypothetical protein
MPAPTVAPSRRCRSAMPGGATVAARRCDKCFAVNLSALTPIACPTWRKCFRTDRPWRGAKTGSSGPKLRGALKKKPVQPPGVLAVFQRIGRSAAAADASRPRETEAPIKSLRIDTSPTVRRITHQGVPIYLSGSLMTGQPRSSTSFSERRSSRQATASPALPPGKTVGIHSERGRSAPAGIWRNRQVSPTRGRFRRPSGPCLDLNRCFSDPPTDEPHQRSAQ